MEVSITPDHITMDCPFTQEELKYLMDLMMGDYLLPSRPEVYKKLINEKMNRSFSAPVIDLASIIFV